MTSPALIASHLGITGPTINLHTLASLNVPTDAQVPTTRVLRTSAFEHQPLDEFLNIQNDKTAPVS